MMNNLLVLFCLAGDFVLLTAANPFQNLYLLPYSTNNNLQKLPNLPQITPNNIAKNSVYSTALNSYPLEGYSSNDLNQLLYKTFLEKTARNPVITRSLPQESRNANPNVVNNYIIVPPEVFQANHLQCEAKTATNEIRRRRQDTGHPSERKRRRKDHDAVKRDTGMKVDTKKESDGNNETKRVTSGKRKRERNRIQDRPTNESEGGGKRRTGRRRKRPKNEASKNSTAIEEQISERTEENLNLSLNTTKSQDILTKNGNLNNVTQHQTNHKSKDETNQGTETTEKDLAQISLVTSNGNILNTTTSTNSTNNKNLTSKSRRKAKKSKKNNRGNENHIVSSTKPTSKKEDALIRDFREKFPNIPVELLKKLIDYMRKQLQNDETSLSSAYNKYLNYPLNFDQFYQTQLANMAKNPQITHINNNQNHKRKSNTRNRRRKGNKKNKNDCSAVIELTPEIILEQATNTTMVNPNNNKSNVSNGIENNGIIDKREPLFEVIPKIIDNSNETIVDLAMNTNTTMIDQNNENENTTETFKTLQKQDSLPQVQHDIDKNSNRTVVISGVENNNRSSNSIEPETALVLSKTVEHPKNERIINIRISVEPLEKQIIKSTSTNNETQSKLKEELTVSKSDMTITDNDKPDMHAEEFLTNTTNSSSEVTSNGIYNEEISKLVEHPADNSEDTKINNDVLLPEIGEKDLVPNNDENEINDYFPNFETDNFAYFLQGETHELERLQDGRYHYTTDRNIDAKESNDKIKRNPYPFGKFAKVLPTKSAIDFEKIKTYTQVEDTIENPVKNEDAKVEFVTPPTLEMPDFETKPVKKDHLDHFIFYDPEADYTPKRYVADMDKTSVYSDVKSPHFDIKEKRDKERSNSNDIETVFAQSKVVKYGHDSEDVNTGKGSSETSLLNNEIRNSNSGEVSIVFAKSFPW